MARRQEKPARLSEVLREFNAEVAALPDDEKAKVLEAVPACLTPADPPARTLGDGRKLKRFNVSLAPIVEAAPADLKGHAREVDRALRAESSYRGEDWAAEGAHLAVTEFITGQA